MKLISLDFDGVIHQYTGWTGQEPIGEPLENARTALFLLQQKRKLVISTTREVEGVVTWLKKHGFPPIRVTNRKEASYVHLDDRVICFDGKWTDYLVKQLLEYRPWWEREAGSPSPDV